MRQKVFELNTKLIQINSCCADFSYFLQPWVEFLHWCSPSYTCYAFGNQVVGITSLEVSTVVCQVAVIIMVYFWLPLLPFVCDHLCEPTSLSSSLGRVLLPHQSHQLCQVWYFHWRIQTSFCPSSLREAEDNYYCRIRSFGWWGQPKR